MYSLGCVVFECLTGLPQFRKEQDAALMHAHLYGPPPSATALRPELPAAIDGVVGRAMAKPPDQRYPRAGELATALRGAATGSQEVEGAPPGRRRGRVWLAIAATIGAVVAAITVFALTRSDGVPWHPFGLGWGGHHVR